MTQMTPEIRRVLAQRMLARRRMLEFTKLTHGSYQAGWVHEDICMRLEKFSHEVEMGLSPRLMLLMPPRHGKLLADDTLVLTKDAGWKQHGDLEIGDRVLNHLGQWVDVIGTSRPGMADCEVITSAGTRILCHRNHEWMIEEYCQKGHKATRWQYVPNVVETREFLKHKEKVPSMTANVAMTNMKRFYLPRLEVEDFPLEVQLYFRYIRRPPHGGRLAIADVRVLPMEERVPGKCVQVNSPDGVYLVTRDLVPTHNSELASIRFPAWHLGRLPEHEIINCSYNLDLPMKFSRKVRSMLRDPLYRAIFPDCQLDPDSQSAEAWNTLMGGGFTAAGVGGGITGKGAHILLIDDPIKNQEEADSIQTRDKLWDWYQSTAYTRLAPGGGVLMIETWWHDDDLAGRLLELMKKDPNADQFEVIKYPALSETYEYRDESTLEIIRTSNPLKNPKNSIKILREPDTCLHEARYPTKALKRIKANLQPRIWSALYQQNPVPDEGMYFTKDMFRFLPALPSPHRLHLYTAWDFAIGEKQQNDWTVGVTILQDHNDILYVLEVVRLRGNSFQIIEEILDVAQKWGSIPDTAYMIGAEDGQIWRSIEPFLLKRMNERKTYPAYEVMRPLTDKMARARPLQGRMQHGHVVFPEHAPWKDQVVQELLRFPAGIHDDVVDALSWAVRLCMNKEPPKLTEPKRMKSWRDKILENSGAGSHMVA